LAASGHRGGMARTRAATSAADFLPEKLTLPALRKASAGCKGCELWKLGTQTVFGDGPESAGVVFVGEQPGDQEDRAGKPFVGPAGRLLDKALAEAGIDRSETYLTNAVKHFKWKERGKRRIHQKPAWTEVSACRPWLEAELAVLEPRVLVLLGATAAQSLLGKQFRVTKERGRRMHAEAGADIIATVHPSSVLRAPAEARADARRDFFRDIAQIAKELARDDGREAARS
jgi:uracil-DNA glycosylase